MIDWPATPDKAAASSASVSPPSTDRKRVAVPRIDTRILTATAHRSSSIAEPSPASTYGETSASDSVPPTPVDFNAEGKFENVQIRDNIYETPEASHSKTTSLFTPSKDKALSAKQAILEALKEQKVLSPSSDGLRTRRSSFRDVRGSNWSDDRNVKFALPADESDPFTSKGGKATVSGEETACVVASTPEKTSGMGTPKSSLVFRPREDREITEICSDNAQALLPPNACVFVANLVQNRADDQLEYSVTRAFEAFGKVYVKIKRDPRGMPYAFCQYENISDSEKAIQNGRGIIIDGRQCRTERAKVNRSLYLTRIVGGEITEEQAREILLGRGDLEKLWHSSPTDKEMYRLPDGIWVTFAFFQDARDAQALFKDNESYRLEQPLLAEDTRLRFNRSLSPSARNGQGRLNSSHERTGPPLNERTSIFVGNLPLSVTQTQLRSIFSHCGVLRAIEIISRPMVHVNSFNVFAFVEFCEEKEARKAICGEYTLEGLRLRVELKELSPDYPPLHSGSPRSRRASTVETRGVLNRELAISRALSLGIHPATAMQIVDGLTANTGNLASPIALNPPVYAPMSYQNAYYGQSYTPYGSPVHASDPSNPPVYSPTPQVQQSVVGHYQYPGMTASQYYASLAAMPQYVYAQTSDSSAHPAAAGPGGYVSQ